MKRLTGSLAEKPLIAILALATALRLPGVATKPLWYDEAFAVLFSSTGLDAMTYGTLAVEGGVAADVHPLAYYSLLWVWMSALGQSGVIVRSLSILLGLGMIFMSYRLVRYMFGEREAVLAGLALALAPFQVHYAQEVRMYALMAFLLIAAAYTHRLALKSGEARHWALFVVSAAAAQYTHTLSAFFLLPLALTPAWHKRWKDVGRTAIAGVAALLLYVPWLIYLPSQLSRLRWAYWVPQPGAEELVITWFVFLSWLPVAGWALAAALFATVLSTLVASIGTIKAWRDPTRNHGLWLLYLALAPAVLMFFFSYWQPVYIKRALLASGAMFLLWLTWGLSRPALSRAYRWMGGAALALGMLLGLVGYYSYRGFPYAPFADVNAYLKDRTSTEVVVHSNKISALSASYYDRAGGHSYLADPPGSDTDTLAPATQHVLGMLAEPGIGAAVDSAEGVWFVMFAREQLEYQAEGYANHPAIEWLNSHYILESTEQFGDLQVFHYVQ